MEPVVRRLILQGFRSFRDEAVDFDNPTFLVGRNGSGKSNLIDALAFLSQAMTEWLPGVFSRRGGGRVVCHGSSRLSLAGDHRTLGLGVDLGALGDEITTARYAFEVEVMGPNRSSYAVRREQCVIEDRDGRKDWFERTSSAGSFRSNAGGLMPQITQDSLALPLVGGDARFAPVFRTLAGMRAYSIDPDALRALKDPDSGRVLWADGSNVASVLRAIEDENPDDLQRSCEILEAIVPAFERVEVKEYGSKLGLEFTQRRDD
jgi:predicted ATPase